MFLHRLELQGFKSFVDKTDLIFGAGITGVIGPNGCGKTNVSDAIRWVMGEQSAKQLRGGSMEDVIFNGCPTRKPLGLAEVHLTFKNDRGILPTEFSEVTISRRVFRSGLSEYFINKTPCRLKDIRDLFFDTGMGSHAYSVIERSMVDHVLSDNSGHRRFLFEEAAGITKYKARKKEALGKLDATEGDLTRLNDIVFEIERELRSLARQVGKARRYQRLRDDVQRLDLALTAGRVAALKQREAEARDRWQEEAVRREGVTAELDALEAKLNDLKLVLLERERELSFAQSALRDREEARGQAEHQVVLLGERSEGLARGADEDAAESARLRERLAEAGQRETEAEAKLAATRAGLAEAQGSVGAADQALAAIESELRQRRTVAATHQQLSLDLFSTEAERRAACERIRERQASLRERRDAAEARRVELDGRLGTLGGTLAGARERRDGLALELDEAKRMTAAADEAIVALAERAREADLALSALRQEAAAVESRLNTLLELKRNYEGVSEGVKGLLEDGARVPGLVGMVADVLEVPARHLGALEASLGEASAFVLAEHGEALAAGVDRLRGLGGGRATLVDLSTISGGALPPIPEGTGVVGRASDLVRCPDRCRPFIERLLGSVVVVEDRAAAARLARGSEGGLRFVSLDGEVWEKGRVRAGESTKRGGLLHREMEIRELSGKLAETMLQVEGRARECEALEGRREEARRDRAAAEAALDQRRAALEAQARELEAAEREQTWARQESAERVQEIGVFETELEALGRALATAEAELLSFQKQVEEARLQVADLDGVVAALEARRDEAAAASHGVRETLLRLSREQGEWETQKARAEETRRELDAALQARLEAERTARARVAAIGAEVAGLQAGLAGLQTSEAEQRERVQELQQRFTGLKDEVQAGEEQARQRRFEQTELAELTHQIELERVQSRAELDRTFERLRSEYRMDPETWTPEPLPAEFDPEQAGRDLEEARERLNGLGPVNVLALEEYTKKKERHEFLVQQRTDLTSAKAQLLEAIEKINTTASGLFVETFAKVQDHFRNVFKTLFEGGDAELRAVGEDPLECEIEIVAKPRGKHLQSISLMSGGERALTAIALLFAIYLVKPSPFCLLDEVDAPLDDANVERFVRMLQQFSGRTQFVVITHNKKTMESARCLYGVTMQELGVSRLVSVRWDGGETGPAPATGAAAAQPTELAEATSS
jgi:chromosome segregation protein